MLSCRFNVLCHGMFTPFALTALLSATPGSTIGNNFSLASGTELAKLTGTGTLTVTSGPAGGSGHDTWSGPSGYNLTGNDALRTSGVNYTLLESATLNNDWAPSSAVPQNDGAVVGDYRARKATVTIGSGKPFLLVQGVEN